MPNPCFLKGFTLIEMLVVLAIMSILLTMALPTFESKNLRAQTLESVELVDDLKEKVDVFYRSFKKFPADNLEAAIPKPDFLIGNYVQRIELDDGAFHITFGKKANPKLKNRVLTIRPLVVKDSPDSPVSWLCGNSQVPEGMIAVGLNKTNVPNFLLPMNCF